MRLSGAVPLALALVVVAPSAAPQDASPARAPQDASPARADQDAAHARADQDAAHARVDKDKPRPFGSACRTGVVGSHVVAHCHNPYPETDRVRLHVECYRWWDIDTDSRPVEAGPAMTVRLTGRCWKEVRSVWVSHQK